MSDLQQRRAIITRTQTRGRNTVIEAQAPLANLFGYSNAMRGLSQGRATCTMEPSAYGPASPEVLERFMGSRPSRPHESAGRITSVRRAKAATFPNCNHSNLLRKLS